MITNDNKKSGKNPKKFSCEKCDYNTSDKKDFTKHISTQKHKMITNDNKKSGKSGKVANSSNKNNSI